MTKRRILRAAPNLAALVLVVATSCTTPPVAIARARLQGPFEIDGMTLVYTGPKRQFGGRTIRTRGYARLVRYSSVPLLQADEVIDAETDRVSSRTLLLPDRAVVRLKPGASIDEVMAALRALDLPRSAVRSLGLPDWYSIRFDLPERTPPWERGWDIEEVLRRLRSLAGVADADKVGAVEAIADAGPACAEDGTSGKDPMYDHQWGLKKIKAEEAWAVHQGEKATIVALVDSGIDYGHIDLDAQVWINDGEFDWPGGDTKSDCTDDDQNGYADDWRGWDFVDADNDPFDLSGHGTHVAGIIGAEGGNGHGGYGVCWPITLMPVRAFNSQNLTGNDTITAAINYAVAQGAHVINCSCESSVGSAALEAAIVNAGDHGVLIVAAAGKGGAANPAYPAAYATYDHVIGVAATTDTDALWPNSNYGSLVEIAAPGVAICSTVPCGGGLYASKTGTSMACAFVSGVAALVKSTKPSLTAAEIKQLLLETADTVVTGVASPVKRVNALAAVEASQ